MERKVHFVDDLQRDREAAASKIKNARGARRGYWLGQVATIDRLLALPRMTKVEGGPGGSVLEREAVVEQRGENPPPRREPRFKVGDEVQLKSGGLPMMVLEVECLDRVRVVYAGRHSLKYDSLPTFVLQEHFIPF